MPIKKVLVLYSGGTIGMEKNTNNVYVPTANKFIPTIKSNPKLHNSKIPIDQELNQNQLIIKISSDTSILYDIIEYSPLLDSSNISVNEWIQIANDIKCNYSNFDGFVVLHGTDTLAYTSSALSFMLENLTKPVIITGSQIPVFEPRTDAISNFYSSLVFASYHDIQEVCVFFHNKLLRGNRTKKISCMDLDAFDSPNYPILGDTEMNVNNSVLMQQVLPTSLNVHTSLNPNVGIIYFYPTITKEQIESFLQHPLQGAVIKTFGNGNLPSNRPDLIDVLRNAIQRGVVIVNVTQCIKGSVNSFYETTQVLGEIGIIPGNDMTVEAAYAKLMVVLGMPNKIDRKQLIRRNLRGEMSE